MCCPSVDILTTIQLSRIDLLGKCGSTDKKNVISVFFFIFGIRSDISAGLLVYKSYVCYRLLF